MAELREYGYLVGDLRGTYTVKELREQGFSLEDLRAGGVPEQAVLAVDGRSTRCVHSLMHRPPQPAPATLYGGATHAGQHATAAAARQSGA